MRDLDNILIAATASIHPNFFHLPIDGGDAVFRERVYCYELYHQMRSLWPENTPYWLNGEVDKSGHAIIRELGGDFAKPDFLIHIPGEMAGNFAIMEVKAVHARGAAIHDDLYKLSLFVSAIEYRRAIYLFYGYQDDEVLLERVNRQFLKLDNLQNIEIWMHSAPNEPARQIGVLPILSPRRHRVVHTRA